MLIRAAAQLLSARDTDARTLAHLAVMERCEPSCCTLPEPQRESRRARNRGPHYVLILRAAAACEPMPCRIGRGLCCRPVTPRPAGASISNGSPAMNNPLEILQTLDRHLPKPAELTLFGRSALCTRLS